MNAKDAILYLYDKGLLNIDAIMKNKDSIMQELDNTTEKLTKHDPCRLFKKGDKVRVVERDGRKMPCCNFIETGEIYTVFSDENNGIVTLETCDCADCTDWFWLELVTPVEELEPYGIDGNLHGWIVYKDVPGNIFANFNHCHPNAKAAAEAERDRLNAEYRKEREMKESKYQDIKESMCCMYCASYEPRKSICINSMQKVKMIRKPCKDFELSGMSAYYHGIETNEDYTYFSERYRREQSND